MNYYDKYKKYKSKYRNLKREQSSKYSFRYFANFEQQIEFINKNYHDIKNLLEIFMIDKSNELILDRIINNYKNNSNCRLFYILSDEKIIALAFVKFDDMEAFKIKNFDNNNSYKLIDKNKIELGSKVIITPIIESLTRNKNSEYKDAGSYLLSKICQFLENNFEYVYLIPESTRFRNLASDDCGLLDNNGYKESNMKLIEFYKKYDFNIADFYDVDFCDDVHAIVFNIMFKKL